MPFYLKERDLSADTAGVRSALIVPCRFCPAASLAVKEAAPYVQLARASLRTRSYDSYIRRVRSGLERAGIETHLFASRVLHHFVMCMWPARRRRALARAVAGYDAVIVFGCEAAVETARGCVEGSRCRVIPGMELEGIMNVTPSLGLPFDVRLRVNSVIRVTTERQVAPGEVMRM